MLCYNCQNQIELETRPTRKDTCPKCLAYLRNCRNCNFYDPNSHNHCREPQAEWVKDKEMANYCDYFAPAKGAQKTDSRKEEALKKLDDLFKKKS